MRPGETMARTGVRVLIVDDHDETRELMTIVLTRSGYEVQAVNSGQLALEAALRLKPDVILLDVMMPEMDGFTVLTRLKDDPRTAPIPVIVVTAKVQQQVRADAIASGAAGYIGKPVSRDELLAGIRAALGVRQPTAHR